MLSQIKHPESDKSRIFFSSDWHIFHDPKWAIPLWKMRGYDSAAHAAEETLNEINRRVGPNDIIYYLGDGFLNSTPDQVLGWLSRVRCRDIRYLFGNHESAIKTIYKNAVKEVIGMDVVEVFPVRWENVEFIGNHQNIRIGNQLIVLNHFPVRSWDQIGHGSWMLSGHQHLSDYERSPDFLHGKCFDVGWEYKNSVWSYAEVQEKMDSKTISCVDHHDSTTG